MKKTQFIPNDPSGVDLYDGKPQERVAQPLAELLKNGKFKLIGLDGSWGAGKSNVIRIVQRLLADSHHFFVYDAWSHQEDLQRRTFLEEFTADLVDKKIVKSKIWGEALKDLLAKKRETSTKTVPKISPAYYAVACTLFLFSITKPLSEMICKDQQWLRLLVSVSPALLLVLTWTILSIWRKEFRDIPTMFSIYKDKELEKETSEIISEKEPSVKQFRDWMTKVSDDLGEKDVIVVFDNIDRLPADKVKSVWSAIQTFFSEAKESYPRIQFIVPFDRSHIGKAFGTSEEEFEPIATHFINKTFPVIFNVALPSLTSWKSLFKQKINEAFGELTELEFEDVENIFDIYYEVITPRNIITFINDIVTLKLVWQDQIQMRYMALYVATRKEILKDPLDQILKRKFVEKAEMFFKDDDELPKIIAALVYNVPLDMASQVTLYREIQTSFRGKNETRVKELYLHPDFLAVLKDMLKGNDLAIGDYVNALSRLEETSENPKVKEALSGIWPMLAGKQTTQRIASLQFEDYFSILIEKVIGTAKLWPLIHHISDEFYGIVANDGAAYFKAFSGIETLLRKHELESQFFLHLQKNKCSRNFSCLMSIQPEENIRNSK